jgi:YtkA-like
MRRVVIGLIGASLLAAASVGSAMAKEGEVVVTLDPPQPPHAGQPTTFSVTVARPDGSPISGETVTFVLGRVADSQVVRATAMEQTSGHYVASITLPDAGSWVVSVRALDQGGMAQTFSLGSVRALPALTAVSKATTTGTLMVPVWTLGLTMILGAALALGGAWGIAFLRRRRLMPAPEAANAPSASTVAATGAAERSQA